MKSAEIISRLNAIPKDQRDLVGPLYDALEDVDVVDDPENLFECAFEFIRDRSTANLGAPGPLSHLIEQYFPLYIDELARSLTVRPTEPTLFLAQRVFNTARLTDNQEAVRVLPVLTEALSIAERKEGVEDWIVEAIEDILAP